MRIRCLQLLSSHVIRMVDQVFEVCKFFLLYEKLGFGASRPVMRVLPGNKPNALKYCAFLSSVIRHYANTNALEAFLRHEQ